LNTAVVTNSREPPLAPGGLYQAAPGENRDPADGCDADPVRVRVLRFADNSLMYSYLRERRHPGTNLGLSKGDIIFIQPFGRFSWIAGQVVLLAPPWAL
jgi:hypothetical protein